MARPRRNILPGRLYLVSQQGNKLHPVYLDREDREVASRLLHICSHRYRVQVFAAGYGEHEGRWLVKPSNRCGLSNMMRDLQSSYSRFLNRKYDHRPCCAHRRMSGLEPCHPDAEPIDNSSNWTPRFKATEIEAAFFQDALDLVESVAAELPAIHEPPTREPEKRICQTSEAAPAQDEVSQALREAVRRGKPLARILVERRRRLHPRTSPARVLPLRGESVSRMAFRRESP